MSGTDTAIAELNEPATAPQAPPRAAALPYLAVTNARAAIAWYVDTFGASLVGEMYEMDDGRIGHAELQIGDTRVCLADEYPQMGARGPESVGGSPVHLFTYVTDVDATVKQALAAGAKLEREVADQFYGDRMGGIKDPFGHLWYIATHKEDVSPEEMKRRSEEMAKQMAQKK